MDPLSSVVVVAQSEEPIVPEGLTASDWIWAGVIFAGVLIASFIVSRVVKRLLARFEFEPTASKLVTRFATALVFVGGVVYVLNSLGVAIAPLLGALGVVGLALAFAVQDIAENFIAGILLQSRRPFTIGDQVTVSEHEGVVIDINLRATVLKTYDGRTVIVPSSSVLKNAIHNHTDFDRRRTTIEIGIGYNTSIEHACSVIIKALEGIDGILTDPAPQVFVSGFGDSSVDLDVRIWHRSTIAEEWSARHAASVAIKEALDDADIDIPFAITTLDLPKGSRAIFEEGLGGS